MIYDSTLSRRCHSTTGLQIFFTTIIGKFFSLLNLRIILRPGVQTNRRQSSRPHCCSTVNRDVIICPKDKSRFAVSENLLRRCMAADYDNILK